MKKIILILALALLSTNVFATSYVRYVSINPYVDLSYNRNTSLSGFARVDAEIWMYDNAYNFIGLQPFTQFTLDYDINYINIVTIKDFNPLSWGGSNALINATWQYVLSNGTAATHLTFFFDYTLSLPASTQPSLWSSEAEWSMNGTMTPEGGIAKGYSAHLVPEPGTLLLLGSGLIGFGVIARIRRKRS